PFADHPTHREQTPPSPRDRLPPPSLRPRPAAHEFARMPPCAPRCRFHSLPDRGPPQVRDLRVLAVVLSSTRSWGTSAHHPTRQGEEKEGEGTIAALVDTKQSGEC